MTRVTIITSVFKGGPYIEGFLADIVQQTAFEDCELFLLDASSPDNEYEVIRDYQKCYKNIRYERLDSDPGIYACWNHMVRNSQSEFLTNANLDDRMMPECIEKHLQFLRQDDTIDLAYCPNLVVNKPTSHRELAGEYQLFPTGEFSLENMVACNLPHNHPVWRRALHDSCGFFREDYKSASDWEFWLRCAFAGHKFGLLNEVLGIYYQNPSGMSTSEVNMPSNMREVNEIRIKYQKALTHENIHSIQ